MPELGLNPVDPVTADLEKISRNEEWRRRAPKGFKHWLFRRLFCSRDRHRAVLDWGMEKSFIVCLDCPSSVKLGGPSWGWRKWPSMWD